MNNLSEVQIAGAAACSTLIEKAWENPIFKNDLINNPKDVFESTLGVKLPSTHQLIVEDQSDNSVIYLNIPSKPDFDELELSDDQLELVAGGGTPAVIGGAALVAGGAVVAVGVIVFIGAAVCAYHIARK